MLEFFNLTGYLHKGGETPEVLVNQGVHWSTEGSQKPVRGAVHILWAVRGELNTVPATFPHFPELIHLSQ